MSTTFRFLRSTKTEYTNMAPSTYLLHVNSRPKSVSNSLWVEWYVDEHLPDLVNAKSCDRATFYEEIGSPLNPDPDHPRKYLALYQTEFEELLKSDEYKGIRKTSELFAKEGAKSNLIQDHGDFDARSVVRTIFHSFWANLFQGTTNSGKSMILME